MIATQIAGLSLVVLVAIASIGQRGSDSIPSPGESEVVAGTAQSIAMGDNLGKAAAKVLTGPVKKELLEVGHKLVDESGAQAYESVREYKQIDPVSGGLLIVSVQLSVFAVKIGLTVLGLSLVFGGIATVVFRMMRNIQWFG